MNVDLIHIIGYVLQKGHMKSLMQNWMNFSHSSLFLHVVFSTKHHLL